MKFPPEIEELFKLFDGVLAVPARLARHAEVSGKTCARSRSGAAGCAEQPTSSQSDRTMKNTGRTGG